MKVNVTGFLVTAISAMVAGEAKACKEFVLSDISTGDLFAARALAKEGEFWALHELCAKVQLVDAAGMKYPLLYDTLRHTSSANFKKFEEADLQLTEKLTAESLESQFA